MTVEVLQVIKDETGTGIVKGFTLHFQQDGGQLDVAGRHVTAVLDWASAFKKGGMYLAFASRSEDGRGLLISPTAAYEVGPTSRLVAMMYAGSRREDATLDEAIRRIGVAKDK